MQSRCSWPEGYDELFLLMRAGVEFDSVFVKDDDGQEYEVAQLEGFADLIPFRDYNIFAN